MVEYFSLLKKSWNDFRNNLVLFLPIIFGFLLGIGFLLLLGAEFFVFYAMFSASIIGNPLQIFSSVVGVFLLVFFVLIDIIAGITLKAYTSSMLIGMYKEVIDRKKAVTSMFVFGRRYFKQYFWVSLIKMLLIFVPFLVLAGICALAFLGNVIFGAIMSIFSFLLFIVYAAIIGFGLFFIEPIIVSENKTAWELIKNAFRYAKNNTGHVLMTWLVMFLVSIIVVGIFMFISWPISIAQIGAEAAELAAVSTSLTVISVIITIIQAIAQIIMQLTLGLFRFNAYFKK